MSAPPHQTPPLPSTLESELVAARRVRPQEHAAKVSWRDHRDGQRLALGGLITERSQAMSAVLAQRKSERDLGPPALPALATLLVRSLRVAEWAEDADGYVRTHRPTPSAGARHPIDVHLLAAEVDGLAAGAWRFDPLTCELVQVHGDAGAVLQRLGTVLERPAPPAALVAVAHLQRTLSRYCDGMSLLWRDAGALLATLHLCASDLGLGSCIVGATGVMRYEPSRGEVDLGSLVVGSPPENGCGFG